MSEDHFFKKKRSCFSVLLSIVLLLIPVLLLGIYFFFASQPVTLKIRTSGTGVVSEPGAGSFEVARGETFEITARPGEGWQFGGWRGDASGSARTLEIEMDDDKELTAEFERIEYSLHSGVEGDGEINVFPEKEIYHHGDVLLFEADPGKGWQFTGWKGSASGNEPQTTVVVEKDIEVTAMFSPVEYSVDIDVGDGGEVAVSPERESYHYGDSFELKASENPGFRFSGWGGDLSGSKSPKEISVEDNLEITAVFQKLPVISKGDTGDFVYHLQKELSRLGFLSEEPDGRFGLQTKLGVKKAQHYFGFEVDGIVDHTTWKALEGKNDHESPEYTVKKGDTLWELAQRWDTTVEHIKKANDLSGSDLLQAGDKLQIPGQVNGRIVEELDWRKVDGLFPQGEEAIVTDVESGLSFRIRRYGGINHADVEPLTSRDTETLRKIYGGKWSWERRAVIVTIGELLIAGSINGYPHGGQVILDNNFNGHICLHFRGSRLHKNGSSDSRHQTEVEKAADRLWPPQ